MKKERWIGLLAILLPCSLPLMLFIGGDLLNTGGALTRGGATFLWDTVTQRQLLLEKTVAATAPDGKTRIVIAPSGRLRWYDLHTNKVFVNTTLSTSEYQHADVKWLSNRRVEVTGLLRYPLLLREKQIVLDRDGGDNQQTSVDRLAEKSDKYRR